MSDGVIRVLVAAERKTHRISAATHPNRVGFMLPCKLDHDDLDLQSRFLKKFKPVAADSSSRYSINTHTHTVV